MILFDFGFSVETGHFYLFGFCAQPISPNGSALCTASQSASHRQHHHPPHKPTNIQDSLTATATATVALK